MAESMEFNLKANIGSVAKDMEKLETATKGVEQAFIDANKKVEEQEAILSLLEKELIKLQRKQAEVGKGTYQDSLTKTTKKLEAQKLEIKDQKVALKDLKGEQKKAGAELKKYNDAQKEQEKLVKDGIGNFRIMGVSLNDVSASFSKIIPAAKAMFGTIKAGILSTGIGALLIAFGSLATYFTSTKKGADELAVIFAKVGAAVDVIKDRISKLGGAIIKVFSGDIKGAMNDFKEATTGVIDEIKEEVRVMGELEQATQKLRDLEMDFAIQKAKTRQEIEKARLAAEDESLSAEERLTNLKRALELEEETTNKELELAREKVRIQEMQMAQSENMVEDEQKLADLKVALIEKETASVKMRRRVMTEVNTFEREIAAEKQKRIDDEKAAQDEKDAAAAKKAEEEETARLAQIEKEQAEYDTLKELQNERIIDELDTLREKALKELEIEHNKNLELYADNENFADLKIELDKKLAREKKKIDDTTFADEKATRKLTLDDAQKGFDSMASILGKESKAGKAAAIASATIQTYKSATSAYSAMAGIPVVGPGLGAIAAGAAIVAGFKNIQAIKSQSSTPPATDNTDLNADVSTAVENAESALPAPEMMSGAFTLSGGQEPDPLKAFVVTEEINDGQEQLADIKRQSTL